MMQRLNLSPDVVNGVHDDVDHRRLRLGPAAGLHLRRDAAAFRPGPRHGR